MKEPRWNPDLMLLDSLPLSSPTGPATFIGIDWGRKDWTGLSCPHCSQPHRFRKRIPKRCRHCGLRFIYTANEALKGVRPPNLPTTEKTPK